MLSNSLHRLHKDTLDIYVYKRISLLPDFGVLVTVTVCSAVPPAPVLSKTAKVTATTITITDSVPSGSVVTGFVVEWQRGTSVGCSDEDEDRVSVNGAFTSYTITGLEPGNSYTMTVTVSNSAGSSGVSNTVTAMTEETGERD